MHAHFSVSSSAAELFSQQSFTGSQEIFEIRHRKCHVHWGMQHNESDNMRDLP